MALAQVCRRAHKGPVISGERPVVNTGYRSTLRDNPVARLVVIAVVITLYIGCLVLLSADRFSWPRPILITVAAAAATGAAVLISGLVSLKRHPERTARRRETDQWMHDGLLPESARLGDALPRIAARIARYQRELWSNCVLLAIWLGEMFLELADKPVNASTVAFFSLLVLYATTLAGWSLYRRIRWTPALRRLLAEGQRRLAEP